MDGSHGISPQWCCHELPSALHQCHTAALLAEKTHTCKVTNRVTTNGLERVLCVVAIHHLHRHAISTGVAGLCSNMPSLPAGNSVVLPILVCVGYELPVFWMKTRPETLTCLRVVHHGHNHILIDATGSVAFKGLKLHSINSCTRTCACKPMIVIGHIDMCDLGLNTLRQYDLLPRSQGADSRLPSKAWGRCTQFKTS